MGYEIKTANEIQNLDYSLTPHLPGTRLRSNQKQTKFVVEFYDDRGLSKMQLREILNQEEWQFPLEIYGL
jgi:hypothetical protein